MNAARTSHLSTFPNARRKKVVQALPVASKDQTSKNQAATERTRKPKIGGRATKQSIPIDDMLCSECLQQAEICREQAQEAARMKRFKAARGLFTTAIALCQRALSACAARNKDGANLPKNSPTHADHNVENAGNSNDFLSGDDAAIQAYLQQLNTEMATYSDLARSMERPLNPHPNS